MSWVSPQALAAPLRVLHHRLFLLCSGAGVGPGAARLGIGMGSMAMQFPRLGRWVSIGPAALLQPKQAVEQLAGAAAEAETRLRRQHYAVLAAAEQTALQRAAASQTTTAGTRAKVKNIKFISLLEERRDRSLWEEVQAMAPEGDYQDASDDAGVDNSTVQIGNDNSGSGSALSATATRVVPKISTIDPVTGGDRRRPPNPPPTMPPKK